MPWKSKVHNPLSAATRRAIVNKKAREEYRHDRIGRLYLLPEWRDPRTGLRAMQLAIEPTCRKCRETGVVEPAREVDHIIPHRGDMKLFLDASNLQSLCKPHHSAKTVKERKR
jgi:5-methylcytosine-specific restriction endonuclease McrA